jgi:uncharacterized protein (TIGR02270 family)
MATSIRQFNVELYRDHLQEASCLYDQRRAYLHDPEVRWPDLERWEDRFEAHIDALVVGGELALEVCRRQAAEGDAGEMHAALRVFCRQDRNDDAVAVLNALDPADEDRIRAASQAMRSELPTRWRDGLPHLLEGGPPPLTQVLAHVIGHRRFPFEEPLAHALAAKPPVGAADLAWALGRVGSARSAPVLSSLIDSDDERTCEAAAMALLRLGDGRVLERATLAAATHAWGRRVLGIGGGRGSVRVLLDLLEAQGADEDTVLALGLLGDLAAVVPLLQLLGDDTVSRPAAVALNTITGAALHADVFVPDEIDPDELSDEERDAYERDGTLPTRGGQPYGSWQRGPLRDQAGWRAWLEENKRRFRRDLRWRMGQPYGPSALLEALRCETSPYVVRSASYEELVVRYGLDVPFEVELRVRQQRGVLNKIQDWVAAQAGTVIGGRWYFAGRIQEGF